MGNNNAPLHLGLLGEGAVLLAQLGHCDLCPVQSGLQLSALLAQPRDRLVLKLNLLFDGGTSPLGVSEPLFKRIELLHHLIERLVGVSFLCGLCAQDADG